MILAWWSNNPEREGARAMTECIAPKVAQPESPTLHGSGSFKEGGRGTELTGSLFGGLGARDTAGIREGGRGS